ncbi:MAG: hypothetical protein AAB320_02870 [Elusimicrobiota bacterium]
MKQAELAAKLRKEPTFQALEKVYAALRPLDPEQRRRVIEALHALLKVSEGRPAKNER